MDASSGPSLRIVSYGTSGGVVSYTVYKIEVSLGGDNWVIYRRYRLFALLNSKLAETVDVAGSSGDKESYFQRVEPYLPPKAFPNGENVIKARLISLNDYLMMILQFRPSASIKTRVEHILNDFFDIKNKGKSGLALAFPLEENKVIRESFVRLKLTGSLFYGNYYVGVLKNNVMFICKKIYDTPSDATLVVELDSQGERLQPSFNGENIIMLQGTTIDISFEFPNREDAVAWHRMLSSSCAPAVLERITADKRRQSHVETSRRKQEERERTAQDEAKSYGRQDIYFGSAGTGNTTDHMSANYGV